MDKMDKKEAERLLDEMVKKHIENGDKIVSTGFGDNNIPRIVYERNPHTAKLAKCTKKLNSFSDFYYDLLENKFIGVKDSFVELSAFISENGDSIQDQQLENIRKFLSDLILETENFIDTTSSLLPIKE
jgi:hypothetical protein